MGGNLVTVGVQVLHLTVIGPLVRDVKGGCNRTSIRVQPAIFEEILVQVLVEIVDGIVKGQQHQLRNVLALESAWRMRDGQARERK